MMNDLQRLEQRLAEAFANLETKVTPPAGLGRRWFLDVARGGCDLTVEWSPDLGFGISSKRSDSYGEGPDEVHSSPDAAFARLVELLKSGASTVPQIAIPISRLRERFGFTQDALADRIGIKQATLSGMERQRDIQVGTLRRIVLGLGGILEVRARFGDKYYLIDAPIGSGTPPSRIEFKRAKRSIVGHGSVGPRRLEWKQRPTRRAGVFSALRSSGRLEEVCAVAESVRSEHRLLAIP